MANNNFNNDKNNRNYCSLLIYKCFKNIVIRNKILSFLKDEKENEKILYHNYNNVTSLPKLIYENYSDIILDKLKSNSFLYINQKSFYLYKSELNSDDLILNFIKLKQPTILMNKEKIMEIYNLLINNKNYNNRINNFNILENYIIKFKSLNHFKLLIKLFLNNNNIINNNNQKQLIDQSYKLFTLLNISIEVNSLEISKYLIKLIKKSNYNNNELEYLNFDNIFITILNNSILTIENINFLKNHLNLNIESIIIKYKEYKFKFFIMYEELHYYYLLLTLNGYELINKDNYYYYYFQHFDFIKIYLLVQLELESNKKNKENYNNLKERYIVFRNYIKEKNNSISNMDELIFEIKNFNIYHHNQFESINYIDYLKIYFLNEKDFKTSINCTLLQNRDIIFNQSLNQFSIKKLKTFLEIMPTINKKLIKFKHGNNMEIVDIDKIKEYIFIVYEDRYIFSTKQLLNILKVLIIYYDIQVLETILKSNLQFNKFFNDIITEKYGKILKWFFKAYQNQELLINNIKKIEFIFEFINIEKYIYSYPLYHPRKHLSKIIQFLKKDPVKYIKVFSYLYSKIQSFNQLYINDEIFKFYYLNIQYLEIDKLIESINKLEENSIQNYFKNHSEFYHKKSNLLIYKLIQSILKKDYNSILKIITITNQYNNYNIIDNISDCNTVLSILNYLFTNNLLNQFNIKIFLLQLLKLKLIEKEQIFQFLESSNNGIYKELLNYFKEYFNEIILLKYDSNDIDINYEGFFKVATCFNKVKKGCLDPNYSLYCCIDLKYGIPLEYFKEFIYPRMENSIDYIDIVKNSSTRFDIFEFYWNQYLATDDSKYQFILFIFFEKYKSNFIYFNSFTHQLINYILIEKKEFISSIQLSNLRLKNLFDNILLYCDLSIYNNLLLIFNKNFTHSIDYPLLKELVKYNEYKNNDKRKIVIQYNKIEYLYYNNLLPNLKDFFNNYSITIKDNVYNQQINNNQSSKDSSILLSISMFLLINNIKNLQNNTN